MQLANIAKNETFKHCVGPRAWHPPKDFMLLTTYSMYTANNAALRCKKKLLQGQSLPGQLAPMAMTMTNNKKARPAKPTAT